MASLDVVILEVADAGATDAFCTALGVGDRIHVRESEAPSTGFRGFTLSIVVAQPATADAFIASALEAGATSLKPAEKSLWGYGGAVEAPDGSIWTVASSAKKDNGPATRQIDDLVLQLGVQDVAESKRFYVDRGFEVTKSFGRKYVELGAPSDPVKLTLNPRRALAKVAGVPDDGTGSHRIVMASNAGPFTDPDGFVWEAASP